MGKHTIPGAIQMRVAADADQAEQLSRDLVDFLKGKGHMIVECSQDYEDHNDPFRHKFFIVTIPQSEFNGLMPKEGGTGNGNS